MSERTTDILLWVIIAILICVMVLAVLALLAFFLFQTDAAHGQNIEKITQPVMISAGSAQEIVDSIQVEQWVDFANMGGITAELWQGEYNIAVKIGKCDSMKYSRLLSDGKQMKSCDVYVRVKDKAVFWRHLHKIGDNKMVVRTHKFVKAWQPIYKATGNR